MLQEHLTALAARQPSASWRRLPSGATLILVPSVGLGAGWNGRTTSVRMVAPVGYPLARPDCFWADAGLRLAGGAMPQNTAPTPVPETAEPALWFSWHLTHPWDPARDDLLTWFAAIVGRLCIAR